MRFGLKKMSALALAAAAVLIALTGCGGKSGGSSSSSGGASGSSGGGTFAIGGILPLSGSVAVFGVDCRNGVELALAEINGSGGVNGLNLSFIAEDDEGLPEKSVNAYTKLVTKDRVNVIIGSITSGCTKAITSLAQTQSVLLVTPSATEVSITDAGDYIFRACFIDPFQGTVGGRFVTETLGFKNAAVLYDISNDYSVGLYDNFRIAVEAAGGTVTAESYSTGDTDFYAQITNVRSANPEVVYLPDYYSTVALIAKQLRNSGVDAPLVGGDGWDGIVNNAGDEVLNGFYSNHYAADSTDPKAVAFLAAYEERYNARPTGFAALGYDCVYMIRDAIAKVDDVTDSAAIRDAFRATDGSYLTGDLSFDERRNPVKSAFMLEVVKDESGALTTVFRSRVDP